MAPAATAASPQVVGWQKLGVQREAMGFGLVQSLVLLCLHSASLNAGKVGEKAEVLFVCIALVLTSSASFSTSSASPGFGLGWI